MDQLCLVAPFQVCVLRLILHTELDICTGEITGVTFFPAVNSFFDEFFFRIMTNSQNVDFKISKQIPTKHFYFNISVMH